MSEPAAPTTEEPIGTVSELEQAFSRNMGWTGEPAKDPPKAPEPPKKEEPKPAAATPEPAKSTIRDSLTVEPTKDAPKAPDLENPAGLSPTASQKFNAIKASREEWKTKASQYEAKIKELTEQATTQKPAPATDIDGVPIDTIKQENKRLSEEIKKLSVERHPRFKAHFGAKEDSIVNIAKNAVGTERAAVVEQLLKQSPSDYRTERLEEMADGLSSLAQARLSRAIDDWDNTQAEKKAAIDTEAAKWDKTVAEEKADQQKRFEGVKTKFEGLAKLALEGSVNYDSFKEIDGDTEHNAKVANNREFIKKFMSGTLKEEVFAFTPVLAAEALHLREKVLPALKAQMAEEISKRDKIIADLQSATPSVDTPADKGGGAKAEDDDFQTVFAKNYKNG